MMALNFIWVTWAMAAPAARATTYDVVVASGIGDRTIASRVALEVRTHGGAAIVRTIHTEGRWDEHDRTLTFDSDALTDRDPWFLRMQHVVATVPARIALTPEGAPDRLDDPSGWTRAVRAKIYASDVPTQALHIAEALIDPAGLVQDLRRSFPGTPTNDPWIRTERIGGVDATRIERCVARREGREHVWTCEGTAEGPTEGSGRLHDVTTRTTLRVDRRGVVELESSWSGTLVVLAQDGAHVLDHPVAERRLVRRGATTGSDVLR